MTDPDVIFVQYLIALREALRGRVLSKEEVLWSLTQSRITIDTAIEGLIEGDEDEPQVPEGWPPDVEL